MDCLNAMARSVSKPAAIHVVGLDDEVEDAPAPEEADSKVDIAFMRSLFSVVGDNVSSAGGVKNGPKVLVAGIPVILPHVVRSCPSGLAEYKVERRA